MREYLAQWALESVPYNRGQSLDGSVQEAEVRTPPLFLASLVAGVVLLAAPALTSAAETAQVQFGLGAIKSLHDAVLTRLRLKRG